MTGKSKTTNRDLSKVVVFSGPRGSGKTLSMVVEVVFQMILHGIQVWSNFPISFKYRSADGQLTEYKSLPLDMNALYTFDNELVSGFVVIDEVNLWADSRRSMGVGNRLLNAVFQLIRKRQLSFLLTVQNFQWLDNRIRWQADALVQCRDLRYAYQNFKLKPGERIGQYWTDMSGIFTGYTVDEKSAVYPQTLWGELFWGCYDTNQEFDILQSMQGVRLNLGHKVINRSDLTSAYDMDYDEKIAQVQFHVDSLRQAGYAQVEAGEMISYLNSGGVLGDSRILGRYLKQVGAQYKQTRSGNFYILHDPEKG